jgi:hypothetical protein
MAITTAVTNSFKNDLLTGAFSTSDSLKVALYTSSASLDASTTAYTTSGEVSGTGYTAGGLSTTITVLDNKLTFSDVLWSSATFTARGLLVYNTSRSNASVLVIDFGSDVSASSSDFSVDFSDSSVGTIVL